MLVDNRRLACLIGASCDVRLRRNSVAVDLRLDHATKAPRQTRSSDPGGVSTLYLPGSIATRVQHIGTDEGWTCMASSHSADATELGAW